MEEVRKRGLRDISKVHRCFLSAKMPSSQQIGGRVHAVRGFSLSNLTDEDRFHGVKAVLHLSPPFTNRKASARGLVFGKGAAADGPPTAALPCGVDVDATQEQTA